MRKLSIDEQANLSGYYCWKISYWIFRYFQKINNA